MNDKELGDNTNTHIMTVHDVAEYLRLSEAKVYKLANAGLVPALRLGKSWRFKKEIIDEWIRNEIEQGFQSSRT
jgi:excisionase family DNA binding protein